MKYEIFDIDIESPDEKSSKSKKSKLQEDEKNSNKFQPPVDPFPITLPFTKIIPMICEKATEYIYDIVNYMSGIKDVDN